MFTTAALRPYPAILRNYQPLYNIHYLFIHPTIEAAAALFITPTMFKKPLHVFCIPYQAFDRKQLPLFIITRQLHVFYPLSSQ
jgi:hypothetical protein